MNYRHLVGSEIKRIRIEKELTQQQLSEKSGLRVATISDIEAGKKNFLIDTLVSVATALGTTLDIKFLAKKGK